MGEGSLTDILSSGPPQQGWHALCCRIDDHFLMLFLANHSILDVDNSPKQLSIFSLPSLPWVQTRNFSEASRYSSHKRVVLRSSRMRGAKGRLSASGGSFDLDFWANATPEEHVAAIFELRELYYEVMHPGSGAERLDRTIGGTRRHRD